MTEETIERVARVICLGAHLLQYPDGPWREGELDAKVEAYWPKWVPVARAAIAALRDPTEAMMVAAAPALEGVNSLLQIAGSHGLKLEWTNGEPPLKHAWRAMIDSALGNP